MFELVNYYREKVMKPDKDLCCTFSFTFVALTVHKTQKLFTCH